MMFTKRPLAGQETLGDRLRQLREERRATLEEASKAVIVPAKYLDALERSAYTELPGLVYARNFVRQYATWLSLPVETAMEKFEQEFQVVHGRRVESPRLVARAKTEFPWYLRHGRFLIASGIILIVLTYLVIQAVRLLRPPFMEVLQPSTDISISENSIVVSGRTQPGVEVRINNQQTDVAADGTFVETVDLQTGLNTLKITGQRKISKPAVVERRVLVEAKE